MDSSGGGQVDDRVAPEPMLEGPITRTEVKEIIEIIMTQLVDKILTRIVQKTEEPLIAIEENPADDHNLVFVQAR